jgi:hypothetical protein
MNQFSATRTRTIADLTIGETGCIANNDIFNNNGETQVERDAPLSSSGATNAESEIMRQRDGYTVVTSQELPQATSPTVTTVFVSVTVEPNSCDGSSNTYPATSS